MATLRLVYRTHIPSPGREASASIFKSGNLGHLYFPVRGVPFSLSFHAALFTVLFFFGTTHLNSLLNPAPQGTATIRRNEPRVVMLLPLLGSGSPEMTIPPLESTEGPAKPSAPPIPGKKGLSYPGRQPILSDPLKPTNKIQTLLQPALKDLPVLAPPLTLPNIVQLADSLTMPKPEAPKEMPAAKPPPPKPPEAFKPEVPPPPKLPEPVREVPPPVNAMDLLSAKSAVPVPDISPVKVAPPSILDAPKLVLPPLPPMPKPKPPEPPPKEETSAPEPQRAETAVQKPAPPREAPRPEPSNPHEEPPGNDTSTRTVEKTSGASASEPSPLSTDGPDLMDLVALTPMPSPAKLPLEIPVGEARGRFAISPIPNLDTIETEPGLQLESSSTKVGIVNAAQAPAAKDVSESPRADAAAGIGSGAAKGKGSGGANATSGRAGGSGTGSAAGKGTGSGTGAGAGVAKKPFSGITIVGGSYDPGTTRDPAPVVQAPRPLQTAYGVTVISTENSGGGLPFVGVFSDEQIYTVYLDMRQTESDPAPSWTLEFAVPRKPSDPAGGSNSPGKSQEGIILPFPVAKERPVLPYELVRKHGSKMVIVYAVINVEGKMEQISVKESPDILLNKPLADALSKWRFRPAQLHGQPVAVKALLGIPLWAPE